MPIEMNELFGIAGKVAVITGAGGVLGGNIAKHFMRQGAKVVAVDIRQEQLDKRVSELKQYGNEALLATYLMWQAWENWPDKYFLNGGRLIYF